MLRKLWDIDAYCGDWHTTQSSGGVTTSVYRGLRVFKTNGKAQVPIDLKYSYFHVGYPYCYLLGSISVSDLSIVNAAGSVTIPAEDHFPDVNGLLMFRKQDGNPEDCTLVIDSMHLVKIGSDYQVSFRVQKPTSGIGQDSINSLAN